MDGGTAHKALPRTITLSTGTGATPLSHPTPHWLLVTPTWFIILLDLICSEGDRRRVVQPRCQSTTCRRQPLRGRLQGWARRLFGHVFITLGWDGRNPVRLCLMRQWREPSRGRSEWASIVVTEKHWLVLVYEPRPGRSRIQFQECRQISILNFDIGGKMRPLQSELLTDSTSTIRNENGIGFSLRPIWRTEALRAAGSLRFEVSARQPPTQMP